MTKPETPATRRQTWAIRCATGQDVRSRALTKAEAAEALEALNAGRDWRDLAPNAAARRRRNSQIEAAEASLEKTERRLFGAGESAARRQANLDAQSRQPGRRKRAGRLKGSERDHGEALALSAIRAGDDTPELREFALAAFRASITTAPDDGGFPF